MATEDESAASRRRELEKRVKDLENETLRKQMEIELLSKIIELANEEYKTDLKTRLPKDPTKNSDAEMAPDLCSD